MGLCDVVRVGDVVEGSLVWFVVYGLVWIGVWIFGLVLRWGIVFAFLSGVLNLLGS